MHTTAALTLRYAKMREYENKSEARFLEKKLQKSEAYLKDLIVHRS